MLIRWQTTSPANEPSFRMSTRSLAVMLPFTLPRTTSSLALMLAWICPLRPTVTRFPGRLMVPSTRPSMYSDSEPVTSPLITRDLPMVACSVLLTTALRGAATGVGSFENVGVVLIIGFSGSGVVVLVFGFGFGLVVLAGFHIGEYSFRVWLLQRAGTTPPASQYFGTLGGQPKRPWHVCYQFTAVRDNSKTAGLALLSCNPPTPSRQAHRKLRE